MLAVAGLLDLVLYRLVGRLFLPVSRVQSAGVALLTDAATFCFHLVGILGLVVFTVSFTRALLHRELFPRAMRFSAAVFGLAFVALAGIGILVFHVPDRLQVHLRTSEAFLAWIIAVGAWQLYAPVRMKVAVTLFAVPGVLSAAANFAAQAGIDTGVISPAVVLRVGEAGAFVAAVAAPWLWRPLAPRPGGRQRHVAALGAALAMTAVLVAGLWTRFDLVQTLALYGLAIDLPRSATMSPPAVLYLGLFGLALASATYFVASTITAPGGARLIGYGVLLLASSGYQATSPNQLVLAGCGMLALAVGTARVARETYAVPTAVAASPAPAGG